MKILHKQFNVVWSWTEIAKKLYTTNNEWFTEKPDKITDCNQYDVILTQQPFMLRSIQQKYKTITRIGTNAFFDPKHHNMKRYSKIMEKCFAIIATNQYLYNIAKQINPNTFLIPNGLDLNEWSPQNKPKIFTVGFVGNISTKEHRQYKGYDFVEEACKQLGIKLQLALYDPLLRSGEIPHDEMQKKFYKHISCIVHPTLGEGSSNTLMEALSLSIPVITTRAAGYHGEMLTDNLNVLFCERNTDSIVKQLTKLRCSPNLFEKLSTEGRKFAEQHHDIKLIAKEYDKIFTDCYNVNLNRKPTEPEPSLPPKFLFPQYCPKR